MVLALDAGDRDRARKMECERVGSEAKDLGIKLFGCKILAPECRVPVKSESGSWVLADSDVTHECRGITNERSDKAGDACHHAEVTVNNEVASGEDAKIHSNLPEAEAIHPEQEKNFKKPDKILPCPRCNSFETKFCYFNNYNVNQPRHFCRNCQRYWTAGGTMRNVPVGAGRRKNKQLPSQYCQTAVSATPNPVNPQFLAPKESTPTLLKFAPETSTSESVETVLTLSDQKISTENKEESVSCGSAVMAYGVQDYSQKDGTQLKQMGQSVTGDEGGSTYRSNCCSVPTCFVPLNQVWHNNTASFGGQYIGAPMLAIPGISSPTIPMRMVAAPYFGCVSLEAAMHGNMALAGLQNCSSPDCSALGKHPRDAGLVLEKTERSVLAPKALRVDNLIDSSNGPPWTAALCTEPGKADP